jgi:hypothetical protein
MSFSHPFTSGVLDQGDLTSGSRGNTPDAFCERRSPTINHVLPAFTQNKRCPENPRAFDDVVNRNAVSVYQTD